MSNETTEKREKRIRALLLALLILWIVFIFARSLKNADDSTAESAFFLSLVRVFLPSASMHFVRKLAHFTEFFILGCLAWAFLSGILAGSRKPLLSAFLASSGWGLAAAVTDELLQLTSPGRSCQISDMLLDLSGAAAGALLLSLLFYILRRKRIS